MRRSAWRGTWKPNARPYISFAPDAYVALQSETTVIGCGECQRKVNFNDYITGISTEASTESPPGTATINMSIPDNDVNEFFVDGQLIIIPMMEIEVYAKGYYLIGGMPQYYRIFWGLVTSVQKNWSNGVTSVVISCKDMLYWWQLTNATTNPAYLSGFGSSAGGYQLWQNQFAGQNPYTTIIQLARDAMGDFFLTTGSFTSFLPERGAESPTIGAYASDVMKYWQLKFSNISSNLVMFGTSGQAYTFSGILGTVSPTQVSSAIFESEYKKLQQNETTSVLFFNRKQQQTFKRELSRAGDVEFFQNETQSKLSLAFQARDQIGFEFYCDTTGDIIFKPPFYNLNVIPNKPVSWIQDIDIIDDSIIDSEAEVVTHVTSSGNAFQGAFDPGISDEITTPRTGVYDFHLLRRYGWRRADLQLEWAGNPRKLFFYLLDWMDRLNAKRQSGTVTIPLRPELRMGFPVWVPKYDSFFYVQAISHQYSPGGQATTTLTLTARRSKFIAPTNIGEIKKTSKTTKVKKTDANGKVSGYAEDETYNVSFPGVVGSTSGLSQTKTGLGQPAIIRDPKTGKLLGYPNVVMVYRSTLDGTVLAKILETTGKTNKNSGKQAGKSTTVSPTFNYNREVADNVTKYAQGNRDALLEKIRIHRYEAGMSNTGAYDYAHDVSKSFKEIALIPADSIVWGSGTDGGPDNPDGKIWNAVGGENATFTSFSAGAVTVPNTKERDAYLKSNLNKQNTSLKSAQASFDKANKAKLTADKALAAARKKVGKDIPIDGVGNAEIESLLEISNSASIEAAKAAKLLNETQINYNQAKTNTSAFRVLPSLNILIRPVSDEFGFEVIGHNRYGRGAFIDRGGLQISDGDKIINQLSIQFSPTGGALTDAASFTNADPSAVNFASLFERMTPDDYVTGASFTGQSSGNSMSNVQTTSAQTYSNLINANKGTGLYIEADATRRAKTLGELKPNINIFENSKGEDAFSNCACGISKPGWTSLLPQELIAKVVASTGSKMYGADSGIDPVLARTQNEFNALTSPEALGMQQISTPEQHVITNQKIALYDSILKRGSQVPDQKVFTGSISSDSFFVALNEYLVDLFNKTYQSNQVREDAATVLDRVVNSPFDISNEEQDNILGTPGGSLFDQASLGDPKALKALQNQANLNFGLTDNAIKHFNQTTATASKNISAIQTPAAPTSPISITTKPPQVQPSANPTLADPINPTRFNSAAGNQFVFRDGTPE